MLNIALFLFIFVKFFGGKIKQQLLQRKADIQHIEQAKQEYNDIIAKAQSEVDAMISEGKQHREKLVQEAQLLGKKKEAEIIAEAQNKANNLVDQAQTSMHVLQNELEQNFVSSVKRIAKVVIHKVAGEQAHVQDAYLEQVAKEFSSQK